MNVRLGRLAQIIAPTDGCCLRCQTPWRFVRWHDTFYSPTDGCFPLCKKCWAGLTVDERLPYYRRWYEDSWRAEFSEHTELETWALVEAAVRRGL